MESFGAIAEYGHRAHRRNLEPPRQPTILRISACIASLHAASSLAKSIGTRLHSQICGCECGSERI